MNIVSFEVLMQLLRDRAFFLTEIEQQKNLDKKIVSLLFCSSIFLALYGAIIGSTNGALQMLSSAFKLPALYLLTLIICLPTLYFLDIIFGSKRTFSQYLALLMASMAVISVMLFGFAPVTIFFRLSINDFRFFQLLNLLILSLTGLIGINFFYRSMMSLMAQEAESSQNRAKLIKGWLFLYGFVGSQLGWTLRPFFGSPGLPFSLFREMESNFYVEVVKIIGAFFGFN
ncbi:MAG: actin-binding WH2 domain-containing protein [Xenococcaceae cyanobacterium MO_234.B1]|nr:actin-binding WH2 domain-containing protein [Xenococcaceae cyanobacterium MO_234.B1]